MATVASAQATLAWSGDGRSIADGYAIVLDGIRADVGATAFSSGGTCGCTTALGISGGRHTVVVIAYNANGEAASAPLIIEPRANAGGPYIGQAGLSLGVSASASVAPTGALVRYTWRWGDGTPDTTAPTPGATHTYPFAGTFSLTLTVTDNAGAVAVATASATVLPPAPLPTPPPSSPEPVPPPQPSPSPEPTPAPEPEPPPSREPTPSQVALPLPWQTADIGNVGAAGGVSYALDGVFTVNAAGTDIGGTVDAFRYVYQPLTGNGRIVARVAGLHDTNLSAKAGLMLRESLNPGAAHALLDVKPDGSAELLARSKAGAPTVYIGGGAQTLPSWLALTKTGANVTASASSDGVSWWTVGTVKLNVQTAWVGLAVTSHDEAVLTTARFDSVTVSRGVNPRPSRSTSHPSPSNLAPGRPIPAPWQHRDVGATGRTGTVALAVPNAYAISGAGADIGDTVDAFHYLYQSFNSDGTLVARVVSLPDANPLAKAGVMIRSGLGPDAAHVTLNVRPTGEVEFVTRAVAGDITRLIAPAVESEPGWLKLTRIGSVVSAFISDDGSNWTTIGSTAVSFDVTQDVVAGLAVTSHDPNLLNTAVFDSVRVSPAVVEGTSRSPKW